MIKQKNTTKHTAMVVDDNEVNALVLANMLKVFDFEVDQIYSGYDALENAARKIYDIIFVDHVMPEMDGFETTKMLRNISKVNNTVIIALTSSVTEEIQSMYRIAGANEVYAKPLELLELTHIIKHWYPKIPIKTITSIEEKFLNKQDGDLVAMVLEDICEINYDIGLRYAIGNTKHYIHILEVSIKDMNNGRKRIKESYTLSSYSDLLITVHNLKGILTNIGAVQLSEEASCLEKMLRLEDFSSVNDQLLNFLHHLKVFIEKLRKAIKNYKIITAEKEPDLLYAPMTNEEYEQCFLKTIYYIKRFEYDSVVENLKLLIQAGIPEYRSEYVKALEEVEDFAYEKALRRMNRIKERDR
jgi:CheY-like chemotaxis protein